MAISFASLNRSDVMRSPIILGHGTNGIGKSSFGYFAPNPIIFDIEDGLILNARNSAGETAPKPPSWRITNFSELMEAFGVLYSEEHDFQTLEVDTLDWLEREIIWPETCRRKGYTSVQAIDFEKGYIDALDVWREYTDAIRALRNERGMTIIQTCHSTPRLFKSTTVDPYDRMGPSVHKGISQILRDGCDILLFMDFKTSVTKTDTGFNNKVTRGVGAGNRTMYTEERPGFYAKNRFNLPPELPLDWNALMQAVAASASPAALAEAA